MYCHSQSPWDCSHKSSPGDPQSGCSRQRIARRVISSQKKPVTQVTKRRWRWACEPSTAPGTGRKASTNKRHKAGREKHPPVIVRCRALIRKANTCVSPGHVLKVSVLTLRSVWSDIQMNAGGLSATGDRFAPSIMNWGARTARRPVESVWRGSCQRRETAKIRAAERVGWCVDDSSARRTEGHGAVLCLPARLETATRKYNMHKTV